MDNQNALAVNRFIIHTDVNHTLRILRNKCKIYLVLKRVRAIYSLVCSLSLIFMVVGYVEVNPILTMSAGFTVCIITVCFYNLVESKYIDSELSYRQLKDAYDRISMTSFKDYDSMFKDDNIRRLLPGAKLMKILYEYKIHHLSITKNGNLAFIYDKDSIQISDSVTIDVTKILNINSKVNIIVDACYIKAVPA